MSNSVPKTLTVILKGEDKTYREKFLIYDTVVLDEESTIIKDCIVTAKKNFRDPIEEVQVKASMVV